MEQRNGWEWKDRWLEGRTGRSVEERREDGRGEVWDWGEIFIWEAGVVKERIGTSVVFAV